MIDGSHFKRICVEKRINYLLRRKIRGNFDFVFTKLLNVKLLNLKSVISSIVNKNQIAYANNRFLSESGTLNNLSIKIIIS